MHISEHVKGCGLVDPSRPDGLLADPYNTEWATIGPLTAMAAGPRAFIPLNVNAAAGGGDLADPATPIALTALRGTIDLRASVTDMPKVKMQHNSQLPLAPAAIRAYLAPANDPNRHLSTTMRTIFDGSKLLPTGSALWHFRARDLPGQRLLLHRGRDLCRPDGLAGRRAAGIRHHHRPERRLQILRPGADDRGCERAPLHHGYDRELIPKTSP